jgi:ATP-dependent protease ClpP protease subunit
MQILNIENKAAKVTLDEVVDGESMGQLMEEIGQVFGAQAFSNGLVEGEITNCIQNAADTLDIEIHSPGGSVLDGYKLYNELLALRERGVHVTAHITLAASMASVIAMAADKVVMKQGGRMMIHEASGGAHGNAHELATQAALLESISDEIAGIYAGKTGLDQGKVRDMMKDETWLSADEAVALGFADSKFDTKKKTKSMNILDRLTKPSDEEAIAKIEALENAAQAHDGEVQEFQAKLETAESALQEAATSIEAANASKVVAEEANIALEAKVEELEAQVASLTEESEVAAEASAEVIENLEEAVEVSKEVVDNRASEILAESGHPAPVAIDEEEAKSSEDIMAEFAKMPAGPERSAFFQAHKDVLSIHAK